MKKFILLLFLIGCTQVEPLGVISDVDADGALELVVSGIEWEVSSPEESTGAVHKKYIKDDWVAYVDYNVIECPVYKVRVIHGEEIWYKEVSCKGEVIDIKPVKIEGIIEVQAYNSDSESWGISGIGLGDFKEYKDELEKYDGWKAKAEVMFVCDSFEDGCCDSFFSKCAPRVISWEILDDSLGNAVNFVNEKYGEDIPVDGYSVTDMSRIGFSHRKYVLDAYRIYVSYPIIPDAVVDVEIFDDTFMQYWHLHLSDGDIKEVEPTTVTGTLIVEAENTLSESWGIVVENPLEMRTKHIGMMDYAYLKESLKDNEGYYIRANLNKICKSGEEGCCQSAMEYCAPSIHSWQFP